MAQMTPEQKSIFAEAGYLHLKGALGKRQIEPIKAHVLDELKRLKVWSSGKTLSASIKSMPAFQQITKLSGMIKPDDLQARVVSKEMATAVSALSDLRLAPAQSQFLISLPHQGEWTTDGLNWHTDISPAGHRQVPGIQAFVLLDDVQPRGGATLIVAGSHRLADQEAQNRRVREILRGSGNVEGELRSRHLSIVELCGRAGDVYLMDMRLLHTPAINSTNKPRLMATVRYLPVT